MVMVHIQLSRSITALMMRRVRRGGENDAEIRNTELTALTATAGERLESSSSDLFQF